MKLKTKLGAFLLASSLLFSGTLIACNQGGGSNPPSPPVTYEVTVPQNEDYTISGIVNGQRFKEDAQVSFSVVLTNPEDYVIDSVKYNDEDCFEGQGGANDYYFYMPNEAVTIHVNYHEEDRHTLVIDPNPIVRGKVSAATLYYGGGLDEHDYTVAKVELAEGDLKDGEVAGDVSINGHAVTGVTAGVVKLDAFIDGVSCLEKGPILVTVREPEKGETADDPFTASEAYQRIQDYGGDKQEQNVYVGGVVKEITENSSAYQNVSFKIAAKNKAGQDKDLLFSRIGAEWDSELRNSLDVGSSVIVCSTLYRSNTTYRVQDGVLYSVDNSTPYALTSELSGLLVKPGETVNPGARIAPKGSSTATITYSIPEADVAIATVDTDGTVHGHSEGSTKLTVASEGFDPLEIPVTVLNIENDGSEEHPFTTDEAVLVTSSLGANGKLANKYVEGIVSQVIENHEGTFRNSTFYLKGSKTDFYMYRVNTGSTDGNNYLDLVKGAKVKANVTLYYYNGSVPETDAGGTSISIDKSAVRLIELAEKSFEVSLQDPDYSMEGKASTYPDSIPTSISLSSGDESVFTIVDGKIHPVATGTATLTVSAGEATAQAHVTVVEGPAVDKWNTSSLVLPSGITKVSTLDEVEFPEVPAGTKDKTTIHGNTYYVVCRVTNVSDTNYGNGIVSNYEGTITKDVRGMMSFDGNYQYSSLTYKPVADSVVVLYCQANVYYRAASGSYSESKTEQLGGWAVGQGPNGTKVMQLDGVVCTTPEVVGIKLSEESISVKAGKTANAPTVSSTRGDAPIDLTKISWSITSGSSYASVDPVTGVVTGIAKGTATLTATYGTTGFTASATIDVKDSSEKVTYTVTISQADGWFTAVTSTSDIDQTVKGVRFQLSQSQISNDMLKVYKNQTLKVGGNDITLKSIVITCSASGTSDYGPGKFGAGAPTGYTYDGKVGTWTGSSDASVNFTATDGQVRITKLVIVYEA